jgi:integrase
MRLPKPLERTHGSPSRCFSQRLLPPPLATLHLPLQSSPKAQPRCAAAQWRNSPSPMKRLRTLRKEYPKVVQYLRRGRTIYIVDCRSRLYGTNTRHVRSTAVDALRLHKEIREKLRAAAKPLAESCLDPHLNAALSKLAANGGNLQQAVDLWIERKAHTLQHSMQPNVDYLCREWIAYKLDNTLNSISQKTANEVRSYGGFICRTWGPLQIASITEKDIESTLEQLNCKNITKRQYLRYINMFLRWAMERKRLISELPTKHISVKVPTTPILIYLPHQIETMWRIVSKNFVELKGWFLICAWAGTRPSETARLTWKDVCFSTNQISVNEQGKTGARYVNADPHLIAALHRIQQNNSNQPLIPAVGLEQKLKMFRKQIQKQQIEWIQDGLRHTCVSYFYAKHKSWDLVEFNFGHSSRTSKQFYQKAVPEVEKTDFWNILKTIAHTAS